MQGDYPLPSRNLPPMATRLPLPPDAKVPHGNLQRSYHPLVGHRLDELLCVFLNRIQEVSGSTPLSSTAPIGLNVSAWADFMF